MIWLRLLLATIFGTALVFCFWLLKCLIVSASPDFAAGLVGGAIWMAVTLMVGQLFRWALKDAEEEIAERQASIRRLDR